MSIWGQIGAAALSVFIFANYGFILMGSMARIRARVQGRIGQPVYQPAHPGPIKNRPDRRVGSRFYERDRRAEDVAFLAQGVAVDPPLDVRLQIEKADVVWFSGNYLLLTSF